MPSTNPPFALKQRSNSFFIIATVAVGLFTDLFLYGLIVPVLPFMLKQRIGISEDKVQSYVSILLAAYAGASVVFSLPAGWIADRTEARQSPFLAGLAALLAATILLAFGQSMAVLVTARILQGISGAVVWTVGLAMVLDTVGPGQLGTVIGSIFSFISVGSLMAPVLGGVLYDKTGFAGVFGVGAGVLGIDFVMRLLVVEKKTAKKYGLQEETNPRDYEEREDDEETALLGKKEEDCCKIENRDELSRPVRAFPILYCLSDMRVAVALLMALVQAMILSMADATVPTEAKSLLGFSSLGAGLLFVALGIPDLLIGPIAGRAVDKYGTKPAAVFGFAFLVPVLVLMRLPVDGVVDGQKNILILWCTMLALNGAGLAIIGSPSIVEASSVVQKYDKANEGFFGKNGPYAQLYGFQSLTFSAGLTLGPVLSGTLRDKIGYGNMNAVFAGIAAVMAVLSLVFIGGKPWWLKKSTQKSR